jgi:rod shape-determining protein MreC
LFIGKNLTRILFFFLFVASLCLFQMNRFQRSSFFTSDYLQHFFRPLQQVILLPQHWSWLYHQMTHETKIIEQNKLLTIENKLLKINLAQTIEENHLYHKVSQAIAQHTQLSSHLRIAYPIMQDAIRPDHKMNINQGYYEGIRVGQAVLSERSIIGQVVSVFSHTAQIMFIDDIRSITPVYLNHDYRKQHLLYGRGAGQPLLLQFINNQGQKIHKGDSIVASGLDGR